MEMMELLRGNGRTLNKGSYIARPWFTTRSTLPTSFVANGFK